MSELEPHKPPKRGLTARHVPQEIVPVGIGEVRQLVQEALSGTLLTNPISSVLAGWAVFEPHLKFSIVDETHTRIELDLTDHVRGASTILFPQRRAEIDRFFIAIQDELDRRERWRPHVPE